MNILLIKRILTINDFVFVHSTNQWDSFVFFFDECEFVCRALKGLSNGLLKWKKKKAYVRNIFALWSE